MAVLIPTKKIPQLSAYGTPLAGNEMMEISVTGTSRRITTRDFVLPIDSIVTITPFGVAPTNARQLISSPTVQVTDNGPGSTVQLDALITGALPGNPTALVGLAAVNGVAVTWMRSDAAPALDVSISPTWLGTHTFAQPVTVSQGSPAYRLNESDAAANNRLWDQIAIGEQLLLRAVNDAGTVASPWATVDRTGTTIDTVNLQATTVQVNGVNVRDATNLFNTGTVPTARLGGGVADATTWLRGDQSWQTLPGGFTGFANPTASIGLAAVNGAATTAMRSDAAPALSQAIAPTWSARHDFTLARLGANQYGLLLTSAAPAIGWFETDAAIDNRRWSILANSEQLGFSVGNDADSAGVQWLAVDRTLNVVDLIALTSTALTWNGNALLSTATAFANPTASVGLAAVNGAATTAMRSDAAPALSQSIAPTWSAQHIFSQAKGAGTTWPVMFSSSAPGFALNETDAAANNRIWDVLANGEQLAFRATDDTAASLSSWLTVDRTGTTIDTVAFPNGVVTFSKNATDASPNITLTNTRPDLQFFENDAAANNGRWQLLASTQAFLFRLMSDDAATANTIWRADRSGTTIVSISFPTTAAGSFQVGGTAVTAGTGTVLSYFTAPASSHVLALTSTTVTHNSLVAHNTATAGDNNFIAFGTEASFTGRGSITYNRAGGLVAYNTTSDARRKKNIRNSPDPGNLLDRIQVRAFEWVDSDTPLDYWFVAQELHAQFPVAVTRGDDDRDWAIDPSKLIPLMVKELQSIRGRLRALETPGNSSAN